MSLERVVITGCASELQGVGRLPNGKSVFVAGALPGEEAEIEIAKDAGRYCEARLVNVITPAKARREPMCPHYGACGGCQAQHIEYVSALALKRQVVFDALTRLGGLENPYVAPAIGSPDIWNYRNKAEFAVMGARAGVFEANSHRVIDIAECALQAAPINRALNEAKARLNALNIQYIVPRANAKGEIMLTLSVGASSGVPHRAPAGADSISARALARDLMRAMPEIVSVYLCRLRPRPAHALDGECALLAGAPALTETLLGIDYEISPRSFFQVNLKQTSALYSKALELANLQPTDNVADIYSGIGTIALSAAKYVKRVTGVEIVEAAVNDARANAKRNNLEHKARFICADASGVYKRLSREQKFDCVFADPPRKGLDAEVLNALIQTPSERLIYVSCNPSTLARDIKALARSAYKFISAHPFDMFPQTAHVETVAALSRKTPDNESVPK